MDPEVVITGKNRAAVKDDGPAPDDQMPDVMTVKQANDV
jgi:hypothetical protein